MTYTNFSTMTQQDKLNWLREAKREAKELQQGDVQPQIDEAKKTWSPHGWTDQQYDYAAAARAGALPNGAEEENAGLPPDYMKIDTTATFNTKTGTYNYDEPTEESTTGTFLRNADAVFGQDKNWENPVMDIASTAYQGGRTLMRTGQIVAQGLADTFYNAPRMLANENEKILINATISALQENGGSLDPVSVSEQMESLRAKLDPETVAAAWDNRPQVRVIQPLDMKDQIISEIGAFFVPYLGASKALKLGAAALRVNPAKLGKYLNGTVSLIKELVAGAFGDGVLAYGSDMQQNLATLLRDTIEEADAGEEGGFAAVGEWLKSIGIEADDLKSLDATEAEDDLDRINRFQIEGAILGVLFPAVLKGLFGPIKYGPKVTKQIAQYAKEGGFRAPVRGGPEAMRGSLSFKTRVKRYTTREEKELLNPDMEKKIEQLLTSSATPKEIAAMAAAGGAKRGWYRASMQAIRHVFGADAEKFTAILASTSPQTQVESNLRNTLNLWKNWTKAGRPRDEATILRIMGQSVEGNKGQASILDAWKNNTLEVMMRDDTTLLSGPKVHSFWKNLMGFFDEVTQDTHMSRGEGLVQTKHFGGRKRVATGKKGIKGGGYIAGNMLIREAADIMTKATGDVWTPAEIQETVWSWVKTIWDAEKGDSRNIPDLLREGAITDDMIRDTPDFATMFTNNSEFKSILEDAGYGQKLQDIPDTGYGQAKSTSIGVGQSKHLKSSAERLDRTKRVTGRDDPKYQNAEQIKQFWDRTFGSKGSTEEALPRLFRRDAGPSGGLVLNTYSLPEKVSKEFNALGVSTPSIQEVKDPASFVEAITKAKETNIHGAAVHVYSPEEYAGMRLFISEDGTAGAALKKDGDMVSLFNTEGGPNKNVARYLFNLQVQEGGTKLDCYDINGYLPTLYSEMGFKVVKRNKFVKKYAPDDWDYDLLGKPDVVYMEKVK